MLKRSNLRPGTLFLTCSGRGARHLSESDSALFHCFLDFDQLRVLKEKIKSNGCWGWMVLAVFAQKPNRVIGLRVVGWSSESFGNLLKALAPQAVSLLECGWSQRLRRSTTRNQDTGEAQKFFHDTYRALIKSTSASLAPAGPYPNFSWSPR